MVIGGSKNRARTKRDFECSGPGANYRPELPARIPVSGSCRSAVFFAALRLTNQTNPMIPFASSSRFAATAALVLGLAAGAFAADDAAPAPASVPVPAGHGLLGQSYVSLGYSYTDFTDTGVAGNTYGVMINEGVREGLDTFLEYSNLQSTNTGLGHLNEQIADFGARAFTNIAGFKPYAEAGLGGVWLRAPLVEHQNSLLWFVGAGVEWQATPDLSITPFVRMNYANRLDDSRQWDYGVKGNYWITDKIGVMATLTRDNSRDMSYGAGVTIRY
jgi:opacity protein-like surface antigen